ncbi:MAG: hypothetical protein RIS50_1503, partial [Bacteroidota bacterium]
MKGLRTHIGRNFIFLLSFFLVEIGIAQK